MYWQKYNMNMGEMYSEVSSQKCGSTKEADSTATDEASERKCCQTRELP